MNDLKFAVRQLLKSPGFTAVAVLTLALGIGANTAIFSVMDAVLLRLLPVKNPQQLVVLTHAGGNRSGNGFSYPVFERLRDRNESFSDLIAFTGWPEVTVRIYGQERPLPEGTLLVSGNYYAGLGINPLLGRLIAEEDNRNANPVAVSSYGFWKSRLGANPSAIGQTVALNGTTYTIIGVTPPEFFGVEVGRSDAITLPLGLLPQIAPGANLLRDPRNWDVEVLGRLKPAVSQAQAKAALRPLFQRIEQEFEGSPSPERLKIIQQRRIELAPASKGLSELRQQFSEPLHILMVVVGLVLVIACANVANLLLWRATARRKEIAVRLALGAGRMRIVRQLLTESVLLALLGGLAGLLVSKWASYLALSLLPGRASGLAAIDLSLNGRVLGFTGGAAILTALFFGLFPAWRASRIAFASALKSTGFGGSRDYGSISLGKTLVAGQVAVSLVLLICASLFVRTFAHLDRLNPGFIRDNLLLFSLDSRMHGLAPEQAFALCRQLLDRLEKIPGVRSVTMSRDGNFGDGNRTQTNITIEGAAQAAEDRWAFDVLIGPNFFETIGTPLLNGRDFTLHDDAPGPKVAILNQTAARHFFGTENPIGRRIGVGTAGDTLVIGIAQDAKLNSLRETSPRIMYRPWLQGGAPRRMTFTLRTAVPPMTLVSTVRRELDSIERDLPLFGFKTVRQMIDEALAEERFFAVLSSVFGLLAVTLAVVGLYGVLSYSVGQRTREIGLRMALGAGNWTVLCHVVGQGMKTVLVGLAGGALGALAAARIIASRLYGVTPTDPVLFFIVSGLLVSAAALACYLPARRAARIEPMEALRCE